MSSSKEYVVFICEQLRGLEDIRSRAMMGEYVMYYRDKVIGGIYDDRFLVKVTKAGERLMPTCEHISPYEGAKEMLEVDNVDSVSFMEELIEAMYDELPMPKPKVKKEII